MPQSDVAHTGATDASGKPIDTSRYFRSRYAWVTRRKRWQCPPQAQARPVIHVPPRREREPKPRSRRTKRAGVSRDGPPRLAEDDEPPLAVGGAS
jgi:hypothetical protein